MAKSVVNEDGSANQSYINQLYWTTGRKLKKDWHPASAEDREIITNWFTKEMIRREYRILLPLLIFMVVCVNLGGISLCVNGDASAGVFLFWGNLVTVALMVISYYVIRNRYNQALGFVDFDCIKEVIYDGEPRYRTNWRGWSESGNSKLRRVCYWEWNEEKKMYYYKQGVPSWKRFYGLSYKKYPRGSVMYITRGYGECIPKYIRRK